MHEPIELQAADHEGNLRGLVRSLCGYINVIMTFTPHPPRPCLQQSMCQNFCDSCVKHYIARRLEVYAQVACASLRTTQELINCNASDKIWMQPLNKKSRHE